MKTNRLLLFLALALMAALLSACGGSPVATTWPGLAASEEAAYLANGSVIYAVRLSDGEELWRFPEKPGTKLIFYSNPVFTSDGSLLVGSSGADRTFFRVDAQTGKSDWYFSGAKDHWIASPLVVGNMIYAPNADGNLYVFDLSIPGDDKLIETVKLGGKLWAQPVSDGNRLYITSLDHSIHTMDLTTYEASMRTQLGGAIPGSPALGDGRLYIGSFDSAMVAINASDGSIAWTTPVKSWVWGGPVLDGGTLYFGDLDGNFYVVDAADGTIKDSFKPDGAILASPIMVNGNLIFVTESGAVYSLDSGGKLVSLETIADSKIYTAPVLAGDLILVAPFQGESLLVALDKDGKQIWAFVPQK
jgi:outer membrane protein assembly factor BamB